MIYNPFSIEAHHDPYPIYDYLLEHEPVQYNKELNTWSISRFEDVWNASRDDETFSSSCGPILELEMPIPILLSMDGKNHSQFRSLVSTAFTPNKIDQLKKSTQSTIDQLIKELENCNSIDVMQNFSRIFPMQAISEILGIPKEDRTQLQTWAHQSMQRLPGQSSMTEDGQHGMNRCIEYFSDFIKDKRKSKDNGLLCKLTESKLDGKYLSEAELLGFCLMLMSAGFETVMNFFGLILYNLDQYPEIKSHLIKNPDCTSNAIDEMLRHDNPGQYLCRTSTKEIQVQETLIPEGSTILLLHAAAMRDPREFDTPNEIQIKRSIKRHLGFGNGPHLCLGAALARMECTIALQAFLKHFPNYQVDFAQSKRAYCGNVRGFECLYVNL